jgi:hypothetical protein
LHRIGGGDRPWTWVGHIELNVTNDENRPKGIEYDQALPLVSYSGVFLGFFGVYFLTFLKIFAFGFKIKISFGICFKMPLAIEFSSSLNFWWFKT